MATLNTIVPNLWFDNQAEEAARFYVSVFEKDSSVGRIIKYPNAGQAVHGMPAGSVMTVELKLAGQDFLFLNAGPVFKFNEAISLAIMCDTQAEVDRFTAKLSADPKAEQCGWVKDRYGLSWQIVPKVVMELHADPDPVKAARVMEAMMKMKKLDIAALQKAHAG